jgi:PPIC-type peptidyl-prolyl cis-trans isomerase-like protein
VKALVIKLFGAALGCMACSSYTERAAPPPIAEVSVENYPKGAWWRSDLSKVALAPAHILIRFAGSATADTDIHVPDIPITRSEVEARLLAQRIVVALRKDPSQFDALAREYSDDLATRERGGRLGTWLVPSLPDAMIDALGHLQRGEISHPVRSALGYHVVRSDEPVIKRLSGSEIVISYAGTSAMTRSGQPSARTRAEALELGARVAREAKEHPEQFAELAARYSDAPDAAQGGDMGERWSYDLWDPYVFSTLDSLREGEVYGPIDDADWGVRIIRRTAPSRETVAATVILVAHALDPRPDWTDPAVTRSQADARIIADELVRKLALAPETFDDERRRHCDLGLCDTTPVAYVTGTSPWAGLDAELVKVAPGEVTRTPVWTLAGFVLARREDPARYAGVPFTPLLELPRPPRIDLESATEEEQLSFVSELRARALKSVRFDERERTIFEQIVHDVQLSLPGADSKQRAAQMEEGKVRAKASLSDATFSQLLALGREVDVALQGE